MEVRVWLVVVGFAFFAGTTQAEDKVERKSIVKRSASCEYGEQSLKVMFCAGFEHEYVRDCLSVARDGFRASTNSDRLILKECQSEEETTRLHTYTLICCPLVFELTSNVQLGAGRIMEEFDESNLEGYVDKTLAITDVDDCKVSWNSCDPNAWCQNIFGNYKCTCKPGTKDMSSEDTSPRRGRKGTRCMRAEDDVTATSPGADLSLWMYILIALAVGVVLLLFICCCCFRHPYGTKVRRKIKHIKILHPPPAPCAPPPLAPLPCAPQPNAPGKVCLQVEDVDEQLKVVAKPNPYGDLPENPGHSAFIANNGFDGNVYIADPNVPDLSASRALPWSSGTAVEYVTQPTTQLIVGEPQMIATQPQFAVAEPQMIATQPQFAVAEPQMIATQPQFVVAEPQMVAAPQVMAAEPQMVTTDAIFAPQPVYDTMQPYATNAPGGVVMLQ